MSSTSLGILYTTRFLPLVFTVELRLSGYQTLTQLRVELEIRLLLRHHKCCNNGIGRLLPVCTGPTTGGEKNFRLTFPADKNRVSETECRRLLEIAISDRKSTEVTRKRYEVLFELLISQPPKVSSQLPLNLGDVVPYCIEGHGPGLADVTRPKLVPISLEQNRQGRQQH